MKGHNDEKMILVQGLESRSEPSTLRQLIGNAELTEHQLPDGEFEESDIAIDLAVLNPSRVTREADDPQSCNRIWEPS